MTNVFIAFAIAAVTEFAKRVQVKDWQGAAVIVAACVIGAVAGWQHVQGLANIGDGITIALGAVGIHTVATRVG